MSEIDQQNNRYEGSIKWFDETKGFGFIIHNESGEDVFMHQTEIDKDIAREPGIRVNYELIKTTRGLRALKVRLSQVTVSADSNEVIQ